MSNDNFADVMSERLDNLIDIIDNQGIIRDEGVETVISNLNNSIYLLHGDYEVHDLSLDQLRQVPLFLCDSILKPHTNVVTLDNYFF